MSWLLVFLAVALADWGWARYVLALGARKRWTAAGWSVFLIGAGAFVTVSYVEDRWLILPAMLGAAVGTLAGVRR